MVAAPLSSSSFQNKIRSESHTSLSYVSVNGVWYDTSIHVGIKEPWACLLIQSLQTHAEWGWLKRASASQPRCHWPWIWGLQEVPGTLSPTVTLCSLGTMSYSVCVCSPRSHTRSLSWPNSRAIIYTRGINLCVCVCVSSTRLKACPWTVICPRAHLCVSGCLWKLRAHR